MNEREISNTVGETWSLQTNNINNGFIKVAPKRMLVCDALDNVSNKHFTYDEAQKINFQSKVSIQSFQENCKFMVRLLGRIVRLEMDPVGTGGDNSKRKKNHVFWIDDGTSKIRVQIDIGLSTVEASLTIGTLVDCIGLLVSENQTTLLYANTICQYNNDENSANIELLRQAEIKSCEHHQSQMNEGLTTTPENPFFVNNILAPGLNLCENNNLFSFSTRNITTSSSHEKNHNDQSSTTNSEIVVVINTDHLMHLIRSFSPQQPGDDVILQGMSENDLAILLNITGHTTRFGKYSIHNINNNAFNESSETCKLRNALKEGLENLQANGQIYLGPNGCYLSL